MPVPFASIFTGVAGALPVCSRHTPPVSGVCDVIATSEVSVKLSLRNVPDTPATAVDAEDLVATPQSKTVCKVSLYFPKRKSWSILLDEYVQMKKQLILKYGAPDLQMETFHHPYKLGDGFETTALQAEKCEYCSIWMNKINTNVIVEISEFLQIYLAFENKPNMELRAKEETE